VKLARKKCRTCGETKPVGDFYPLYSASSKRPVGADANARQSRCKLCDNMNRSKVVRGSVPGNTRGPDKAPRKSRRGVDVDRLPDGTLVMVRR